MKLAKLNDQRLLYSLLYFNNFQDDFKEIHKLEDYKDFILSKRFTIYAEKVKIRIPENIKNSKTDLVKIDKIKLDNL